MKNLLIVAVTMVSFGVVPLVASASENQLPENGRIKLAVLSGRCEGMSPPSPSNLYLTKASTSADGYGDYPELLITCANTPEIGGSGFTLTAAIGKIDIADMDYYLSLAHFNVVGESHTYRKSVPIKEGMTYSAMLNTPKYRGLMVFKVISYKENVLTIEYATRVYEVIKETQDSIFIDHKQKNSR